jgi:pimeloyl-ACP methyl ester carboxylesterase
MGVAVPELVLPDDHSVILGDMRFHYLDWGTLQRPAVVFLHGGGLTAHTWDLVCLALRPDFHCLALDQRGHGDSEWSPEMDYRREAYVRDLESFVDYLGLDRFILVGMSLGGLNSLDYASQHSDRLDGLVVVDVGPDIRLEGARNISDFVRADGILDSVEAFVERAVSFNPRRDPELLRRSLLYNLRQLPDGKWMWKYDRRHRMEFDLDKAAAENRQLWQVVPNIACPALVVRGAESHVFLDEDAEKLSRTLPNGRWTCVRDAGHTVQGDNPRTLIEEMGRFFAEIGS